MSTSQNRDREHKWRLRVAGSARGPYSQAYILAALLTDKLPSTVSACLIDTGDWRPLSEWPEFAPFLSQTTRAAPDHKSSGTRGNRLGELYARVVRGWFGNPVLIERTGVALAALLPGMICSGAIVFGLLGFPWIETSGLATLLTATGELNDGRGRPISEERLVDTARFEVLRNPDGSASHSPNGAIWVQDREKLRQAHEEFERERTESRRGWALFYLMCSGFFIAGWSAWRWFLRKVREPWLRYSAIAGYGLLGAIGAAHVSPSGVILLCAFAAGCIAATLLLSAARRSGQASLQVPGD
jgi:hypothetical protein